MTVVPSLYPCIEGSGYLETHAAMLMEFKLCMLPAVPLLHIKTLDPSMLHPLS